MRSFNVLGFWAACVLCSNAIAGNVLVVTGVRLAGSQAMPVILKSADGCKTIAQARISHDNVIELIPAEGHCE